MGRRDFLVRSAIAAGVAALVAACGSIGDATAPASLSGSIRVSDFPALASVGGIAVTSLSGSPVAIVRTSTSSFVVLSRICPHQGSTVNVSGSGFLCPNHGAQFSSTGTWQGGERTSNMHAYPSTYDSASGTITVS